MSAESCSETGGACAGGKGVCSGPSGVCLCNNTAYEDTGDLVRSTGCTVHVQTFTALWSIAVCLFAVNAIVGVAAIMCMKRKRRIVQRNDSASAWLQLLVSCLGLILGSLQLSSSPSGIHVRRLGVDPATSMIFMIFVETVHLFNLLRPMARSETSIARFILERSSRWISAGYKKLVAVSAFILGLASIAPVVSAYHPELEPSMVDLFGVSLILYFTRPIVLTNPKTEKYSHAIVILAVGLLFARTMSVVLKEMERAIIHASLSGRSSLRRRVQAFSKRARRTMYLALLAMASFAVAMLLIAVSDDVAKATWFILPTVLILNALWSTRALFISLSTSVKHRSIKMGTHQSQKTLLITGPRGELIVQVPPRDPQLSSEEERFAPTDDEIERESSRPHHRHHETSSKKNKRGDEEHSTSVSSSGLGQSSSSLMRSRIRSFGGQLSSSSVNRTLSGSLKRNRNALGGGGAVMSIVPEADFEGTVIVTTVPSTVGSVAPKNGTHFSTVEEQDNTAGGEGPTDGAQVYVSETPKRDSSDVESFY